MPGRIALVTGASSGIGRAAATELTGRGLQVMATARREELLKELARQSGVSYIACPLETPDGPEKIMEETRRRLEVH